MTVSVVRHKRGTSIQWASATYVLKDGEIGIDKTLNKIKIGNGSSLWSALPFVTIDPSELAELAQDAIDLAIVAGTGITKTYNDVANTITLAVDSTIANKTYVDTAVSGLQSASIQTYIPLSLLGQVDGVAELDSDGVIPDSQIPAGITRDTELSSAVSTAINNLIDGAPAALDTLNELAAAINDDASYASTITTALGTKEPLLPSQTGNSGKFLTTDGTAKSWSTVAQYTLPTQTSNSGKFLTTDGSVESWATIPVTPTATAISKGTVYGFSSDADAGSGNVAYGWRAMGNITTGTDNLAIGFQTLFGNTTGINNLAIGKYALLQPSSASSNTAIGMWTLHQVSTGSSNVAIGPFVMYNTTIGNDNVAIANNALNYTNGDGNIGIGSSAGNELTTGSNNIIIGTYSNASSATVSNEITLGNSNITKFRIPGLSIDWSTTAYGRATYASTSAPSGGNNGDVWLVYTP
jgi:hypothetical protein